jgi:hypothetical protein
VDFPETHLALQGAPVPIISLFSDVEEWPQGQSLPGALLALLPLLERACGREDLDRELPAETLAHFWCLLNERCQSLREAGVTEQSVSTATLVLEFVEILVECVHHGLTPYRARSRLRLGLKISMNARRGLAPRAQRLLVGEAVAGTCGEYADLFQLLALVWKRSCDLKDVSVFSVSGRPAPGRNRHAWNWLVSRRDGWILPIDIHSAATMIAPPIDTVWNTQLDGTDMPNVSAFASELIGLFGSHPLFFDRPEVPEFFDLLFASAGEQRRALAYKIAQHGLLHPEVEERIIRLWRAPLEQEQRRAHLGPPLPLRGMLSSAEEQTRLFARVFDE